MKKIGFLILKVLIIPGVMLYIIVTLIFRPEGDQLQEIRCNNKKRATEEAFEGVIVSKFLDEENHLYKTIEYSNSNGVFRSYLFATETSRLYDSVIVGDKVVKQGGSLEVTIQREGKDKVLILDHLCK